VERLVPSVAEIKWMNKFPIDQIERMGGYCSEWLVLPPSMPIVNQFGKDVDIDPEISSEIWDKIKNKIK